MLTRGIQSLTAWWLSVVLVFLPVISPCLADDQLSIQKEDLTAPEIIHVPVSEPIEPGESYEFSATVTDNVKVKTVDLFYRSIGETQYKRINMKRLNDNSDVYNINLDSNILAIPGIEYYIQAVDISGNSLLHGYSFSPLKIAVGAPLTVPDTSDAEIISKSEKSSSKKWLWIGLGVLAVGALAAGGGGGGSDNTKPDPTPSSSLFVTAPAPE